MFEALSLLAMFKEEIPFFQLHSVHWFKVLDKRLLFFRLNTGMIYNSTRPSVKILHKMVFRLNFGMIYNSTMPIVKILSKMVFWLNIGMIYNSTMPSVKILSKMFFRLNIGMIDNSTMPTVKILNKMVFFTCIRETWWILMKKVFDCLWYGLVFHYAFPVVQRIFCGIVLLCRKHKLAEEGYIFAN